MSKPPWAFYIWSDGLKLFLEHPAPEGKPGLIEEFNMTEGGLGKVLDCLRIAAGKERPEPLRPGSAVQYHNGHQHKRTPLPKVKRPAPTDYSDALRESVKGTLRRLNLT